jgi:adenylylsulfate kinase-like enzyme
MIYNFIGQPHAGKTTLANHLKNVLENHYKENEIDKKCILIDGDNLRAILNNKDFSEEGRRYNINQAYNIAKFLDTDSYFDVIIAVVSPFLDLRERLKIEKEGEIVEIFVHTTNIRGRENFHVPYFEEPQRNFIDVDTTDIDEMTTMNELLNQIQEKCQSN